MGASRATREQDFWDQAAPGLEKAWRQHQHAQKYGLEPNAQMAVDALGTLAGRRVLDFACGGGVLSCFLATAGAQVTGVDLSPVSIEIAQQLARLAEVEVRFLAGDLPALGLGPGSFDAVIGFYALHHVDVAVYAPALAALLTDDGRGAFLETIAANPLLRVARRHVVGHLGIPRLGTPDEYPLTAKDIAVIREAFKELHVGQAEYLFLSMIDRQVLYGRYPRMNRALEAIDRQLARVPILRGWSYRQVLTTDRGIKPPA